MKGEPQSRFRQNWPLAATLMVIGLLYLGMANPEFRFMEGASAIKLLHARSLLSGLGYRDIGRMGTPPEIVRPPGFPILLAAVMACAGENFLAMKLANNFFGVLAAIPLVFLFRRRNRDPLLSAAVATAGCLFPGLYFLSRYLEAELVFCFLFFSAIAMFDRAQENGFQSLPLLFGFVVSLALSCLVRTAGLVLVPAALLVLGLARSCRRRERVVWATAVVLGWGLSGGVWMLRNQRAAPAGEMTYLSKLRAGEPVESVYWLLEDQRIPLLPPPRPGGIRELGGRVVPNLRFLFRQVGGAVYPPAGVRSLSFLPVLLIVPGVLFLAGLTRGALVRRGLPEAVMLFYPPMILLWPYQDNRFLLPLVPFLLLYLVEGAQLGMSVVLRAPRWSVRGSRAAALGLAFFLVGIFGLQDARHLISTKKNSPLPVVERSPFFRITSPHRGAYHSLLLLEWLREHAAADAVIMYHSYPPCAFLTGRVCTPFPLVPADRLMRFIDEAGVDYVLVDDEAAWGPAYTSAFTPRYLIPLIEKYPRRFEPTASAGDTARLYRVVADGKELK